MQSSDLVDYESSFVAPGGKSRGYVSTVLKAMFPVEVLSSSIWMVISNAD